MMYSVFCGGIFAYATTHTKLPVGRVHKMMVTSLKFEVAGTFSATPEMCQVDNKYDTVLLAMRSRNVLTAFVP